MHPAILIVSALTAGAALARKLLSGEVTSRKHKAIEAAAQEARIRIRREAHKFLKKSFLHFAIATGVKAGILATLWIVWRAHGLSDKAISISVGVSLVAFLIRDAWVIYPTARFVISTLVRNGWHPLRALRETVAALVFEEVLAEAQATPQTRSHNLLLTLAGHNRDDLHKEIAESVADIARHSSWDDLKPYIFSAAAKTVSIMALYGIMVAVLVSRLP
ncbi:MAG: hypothetical protein RH945_02355 [Hyphomonas sp.]|tara:strand:+ start:133 stop:789 length:657 start_codon:yes stop_codon:yes gene_type:complete